MQTALCVRSNIPNMVMPYSKLSWNNCTNKKLLPPNLNTFLVTFIFKESIFYLFILFIAISFIIPVYINFLFEPIILSKFRCR